jgi:hypothetical protein
MMTKEIYLERYYKLRLDVNFIYSKSIEFQVPSNIIEQILCLGENCEDVINEIKKFDSKNQNQRCYLIEEAYEDLKLDYCFILMLLSRFNFESDVHHSKANSHDSPQLNFTEQMDCSQ